MSFRSYPNRDRARRQVLRHRHDSERAWNRIVYSYTPQAHGARGDGVHDDTVAVQAALDRGWAHFPRGAYKVTGPITLARASA